MAGVIERVAGGVASSPKKLLELATQGFVQSVDGTGFCTTREYAYGVVGPYPWYMYVRPGYYMRVWYSQSVVAELTIRNEDGMAIRPSIQIGPIPQSFARSHVRYFLNSFMRQAFSTAVTTEHAKAVSAGVAAPELYKLRALPQIALRNSHDGTYARLVVMKKVELPTKQVIKRKNFNMEDMKYTVDLRNGATIAVEGINWQAIADTWGKEQVAKS